jgi:hypothetical protein
VPSRRKAIPEESKRLPMRGADAGLARTTVKSVLGFYEAERRAQTREHDAG